MIVPVLRRRALPIVIGLVLLGASAGRARASVGLDPFRRVGAGAGAPTSGVALDPIRVADADAKAAAAPPAAAPPPPKVAKACASDDDCPDETICQQKTCQAIQGTTNILYLYYREGTFREIALVYWAKRGSSGFNIWAPLYWHTWTPKSEGRVVAPFFWRFHDYAARNVVTVVAPFVATSRGPDGGFTWVFPLNFGWHDKDSEHALILPLFYASKHKDGGSLFTWIGFNYEDADESDASFLWLYWHGEDRKEKSAYNVVFPLLWDFKDKDDRSTVFFPLVWSWKSADTNSTLTLPLLWLHLERQAWRFDTVFPLWWSGSDEKAGTAHKLLVPLFYWEKSEHGRATALISPLGGYSWDDDARSRTLAIVPLLSFWRHDPTQQLRVFTPLYVHHHSEIEDSTTRLYGLLLYLRTDPQGTTRALLPLFWRFHDATTDATATALLPFFARRAGPRDTTTIVGVPPVWAYWRSFKNGGWSGGLFPIAYFGDNAGRSHAVVAPLFWRWAGANDSTTVVVPLFYWHRDPRGHAGGILPLLTFFGADKGDSYTVQFPLLWHFASERLHASTTATPLGYFHSDRDGWSLGLGPIVPLIFARSGATRSHFVLFPIVWHFRDAEQQRSTTVVGPFWRRSVGGESTTALFPILFFRSGARPGGADETTGVVLPLFYYHRDAYTRVLVTPVGFAARGPRRAAGFFGPFFWFKNQDLDARFIPLLYADLSRRSTGERTRQVGPFFALDGPGHKSRVLVPLFGHYEDAGESDTYVFPSIFHQRRADGGKVDTFLPFFWHSSGGDRETTVIGLWYDHTAPGVHDTGFAPFYFHARNAARSLTIIPLLLAFHEHDVATDADRTLAALFWHTRDKVSSSTVLFPLWWSGESDGKSHHVVFPIFWRFADAKAKQTSTLLGPFLWASRGTDRTYGLMPLLWFSHDPADGSGSAALMPIFYRSHGPDRSVLLTPLFGFKRTPTSSYTYGGPIVPLFFSRTDNAGVLAGVHRETHTTIVPPLLLYTRRRPDDVTTSFLAIFWHHRDVTSSTTLGLPLYYDFHDFTLSRTTVLFPLYFRHANEVAGTSLALAPLFFSHSTPEGSTTVAFPLYWHFESGGDQTTVLVPLYAHWRRPDHASTWVFPTIYHRTGLTAAGAPDGTWHWVVAPFYNVAVKRPGDFMWEILGGLVGHERIGRNRYLKVFFMRFEQEPAPRAQTAWYSQPLRTPRRETTRGLSMNTW
ncbi:MAG TPA: hypothetical protein VLA14_12865 [Polyangia bacterium]|nr:hypothetical protein [Polyangia bacterium]